MSKSSGESMNKTLAQLLEECFPSIDNGYCVSCHARYVYDTTTGKPDQKTRECGERCQRLQIDRRLAESEHLEVSRGT